MVLDHSTYSFVLDLAALSLVAVPAFHLARGRRSRNLILGLTGATLTFYIAPRLLVFFVVYWLLAYIVIEWVARRTDAGHEVLTPTLLALVALLLVPLLWWRLDEPLFVSTVATRLNDLLRFVAPQIAAVDRSSTLLPVGLSFATFRAIDQLIKTSLGIEKRLEPSEMFAYAFFPTVLVVGPIIERNEVAVHRTRRAGGSWTIDDYLIGLTQVTVGAAKVFVFSRPLEQFRSVVEDPELYSTAEVWVGLTLFYISFYLNFAGYSDMAIGFARFFGFELAPNFRSPLTKGSPQQFWNSWHMSLTRFAQRNVFIPLGGFRKKSRRVATALTMLVIALWHGLTFGLVIFALWHTLGLFFWPDPGESPSQLELSLRVGATFLFVLVSLPLLLTSTAGALDVYRSMLGVGA